MQAAALAQQADGIAADGAALHGRARALAPLLRDHIAETDRLRDTPPAIADALRASGLLRLYQPAAWGGYQSDPAVFLDVQNALAEECASTAWVQGVLAVQPLVLARFAQQAQADVWGSDPAALISSSFQPTGKAEVVEGGYRLHGRWGFSSGCSLCDWAVVGALLPPATAEAAPQMCLFLVPRTDYRIDDVWQVFGMRGTGSNDIVIESAFVPEYRTHRPDIGILYAPGGDRTLPALYRLPWLPLFALATSNLAVGAGRGALRSFLAVMRTRIGGLNGKVARDDPAVHEVAARLAAEIEQVDATNRRTVAWMLDHVATDTPMPLDQALLRRVQGTSGLRRIAAIVEEMTLLLGARGARTDNALTRIWLDLCAARLHPGNDPSGPSSLYGSALIAG